MNTTSEQVVAVATVYRNHGSLAITIPKVLLEDIGIRAGDRLVIKKDGKNRVIYERQAAKTPTARQPAAPIQAGNEAIII